MLRKLTHVLAAFGVTASIACAHAGTLSYTNYSILNGQSVHLTDAALHIDETASAGQITLANINGGNTSVATFCIDIADWLQSSGSFITGGFVSGAFGSKLNALLTNVTPVLNTNSNASAALQVAIWKAEYGSALTVSGNEAVISLANTYLSNVNSGLWTGDPNMVVAKLEGNGRNQDQAYLSRVPEPATFAVLGAGLIGLVAARRWRRREAHQVSRTS